MNIEKLVLEHKLGVKTSKYLYWKHYPEAATAFELQQGAPPPVGRDAGNLQHLLTSSVSPDCGALLPASPSHTTYYPLVITMQSESHGLD